MLIVFGFVSQLDWSEWQPIGWAVIMGGGYLSLTHPGGLEQPRAWLVTAPTVGFLLGYTALHLTKPYWVAIDAASVLALIAYAALEWRADTQ
jgi:hypothetical protein